MSISKLSKIIGIPERTISSYERGERTPSVDFLAQLCIFLNINANWFLTGKGEMFNEQQASDTKDGFEQNVVEVLKKYGKTIRVDHRTLDEQQEEAEAKGDTFLSKVNLRVAEEYVGIKRAHTASPFVEVVKKTRERNFKKFIAFFREDVGRVASKENEVKRKVKQAEITAREYPEFSKDIAKDEELLDIIASSGCYVLSFGLESISKEIRCT